MEDVALLVFLARELLSSLAFENSKYKKTLLWFDDLILQANAAEDELKLEELDDELYHGHPEFYR